MKIWKEKNYLKIKERCLSFIFYVFIPKSSRVDGADKRPVIIFAQAKLTESHAPRKR